MQKTIFITIMGLISFSVNAQTADQQQIRKENLEKRIELQESRNPDGVGVWDTKLENRQKVNAKKIEVDGEVKASGREEDLRAAQQKRNSNLIKRSDAQAQRNPNGHGNRDARLDRKSRVNERRLKF